LGGGKGPGRVGPIKKSEVSKIIKTPEGKKKKDLDKENSQKSGMRRGRGDGEKSLQSHRAGYARKNGETVDHQEKKTLCR